MQTSNAADNPTALPASNDPPPHREPDFTAPLKPIAEFVTRPDFPDCLLGEHVDIGGVTGVVVAIVRNSIKVRSPEGTTQSFNFHGLRRIYSPPPELETAPPGIAAETVAPSGEPASGSAAEAEAPAAPRPETVLEPDFSRPVRPIAELVTHADFPENLLGEHVDIGGYFGVVIAVVKQSVKVRSPEGMTRSFNSHGLRRIYGPPPPEPEPLRPARSPAEPAAPPAPKREVIAEPDFNLPIRPIAELVKRADFPRCAFGEHVDIGGYTGVVVEIVNQSLKVRSPQGTSRSYNAAGLRQIYGQA